VQWVVGVTLLYLATLVVIIVIDLIGRID